MQYLATRFCMSRRCIYCIHFRSCCGAVSDNFCVSLCTDGVSLVACSSSVSQLLPDHSFQVVFSSFLLIPMASSQKIVISFLCSFLQEGPWSLQPAKALSNYFSDVLPFIETWAFLEEMLGWVNISLIPVTLNFPQLLCDADIHVQRQSALLWKWVSEHLAPSRVPSVAWLFLQIAGC